MKNEVAQTILSEAIKRGKVSSASVAKRYKISRQAAHKTLANLTKKKKLLKIGKTKGAYYIPYSEKEAVRRKRQTLRLRLKNKSLQEDIVFDRLALSSNLISDLSSGTKGIFRYAFTEMLNNAIEHSKSSYVTLEIYDSDNSICFKVIDQGIGIYNSIKLKYHLQNDFEAVQELLKGKKTTAPEKHSGEGIFFTSKISDLFEIYGGKIRLIIDNKLKDLFVKDISSVKGTRIVFQINKNSKKDLGALFTEYTSEDFKFSKTKVVVKLFEKGTDHISRSQARRLLFDLTRFQTIVLDFNKVKEIGQGFADEIFAVFSKAHPEIEIKAENASPAVEFMIKRARSRSF